MMSTPFNVCHYSTTFIISTSYILFISLQDLEVKLREVRGEITNGKSATDRGLLEEEIDNSKKGGEGNSIFNKKIKVEEKIDEELNTKENEFHGRILAE